MDEQCAEVIHHVRERVMRQLARAGGVASGGSRVGGGGGAGGDLHLADPLGDEWTALTVLLDDKQAAAQKAAEVLEKQISRLDKDIEAAAVAIADDRATLGLSPLNETLQVAQSRLTHLKSLAPWRHLPTSAPSASDLPLMPLLDPTVGLGVTGGVGGSSGPGLGTGTRTGTGTGRLGGAGGKSKTVQVLDLTMTGDVAMMEVDNPGVVGGVGEELYCFCQKPSFGEMVGCDADGCPYEWFHFHCVGLSAEPRGKWYCPECREMRNKGNKGGAPSTPRRSGRR